MNLYCKESQSCRDKGSMSRELVIEASNTLWGQKRKQMGKMMAGLGRNS